MSVAWSDIAFVPDPDLAAGIIAAWQWLVPGAWTPFLCSTVGGIFFEEVSGVYWLDSGTGLVERVAEDAGQFESLVKADPDRVDEWFLPPLVQRLHDAGKRPGPGECYAFIIQPVFAEGRYEVANMIVAPAREQLVGGASIHEQLGGTPNGGQVGVKIVD